MKEIMTKLTIYVAQPGDTLLSIAQKYQMLEADLLKFNPLLRHRPLKPGYPINILIKKECPAMGQEPVRHHQDNLVFPSQDQELSLCLVFYIKETLYAQTYAPRFFDILKSKTLAFFEQLIEKYEVLTLEGNIEKLHQLFLTLFDNYLTTQEVVKQRSIEAFKLYQVALRKDYDNFFRFLTTINDRLSSPTSLNLIDKLYPLFSTLALKLRGDNFQEVEDIFQEIVVNISLLGN